MSARDSIERRRALSAHLRGLNEVQRWQIAEHLSEVPSACWSDLCIWAVFAAEFEDDDDPADYVPDTTGAARCAMDAVRDGACNCGKFRAGREVSDGRA